MNYQTEVRNGTTCGTLLAIISNMAQDVWHTAIVAATGALVSFICTMLFKWIMQQGKKNW